MQADGWAAAGSGKAAEQCGGSDAEAGSCEPWAKAVVVDGTTVIYREHRYFVRTVGGDGMVRQPWRGLWEEEEEDEEDGDEYGRVRTSTTPTGEGWVQGWDGDQDEEEEGSHRQSAGLAGNMNSSAGSW